MGEGLSAITLFMIEDHQLTREALRCLLKDHVTILGEASSGQQALERLSALGARDPDITLLDLSLPDIHGLILLQTLHDQCPGSRMVILTAHKHPTFRARCLRAGAAGFLTKDQPLSAMLATLNHALSIQPVYSKKATYQPLPIKPLDRGLTAKLTALSDVELHLWLAITEGRALTEIAKTFGRSVKTIRENRQSLLRKLACKDAVDLTRAAVELGLVEPHLIQSKVSASGQFTRVMECKI